MKQITLKLLTIALAIILCFCCFTACNTEKGSDNNHASPTDNYATNDNTGESIDANTDPTVQSKEDDKNEQEAASKTESKNDVQNDINTQDHNNDNQNTTSQPTVCQHNQTKVVNKKLATCTEAGYSGDTYCKSCNTLVKKGSKTAAIGHKNTEVRNKKNATTTTAGYTGDTYCKDCGVKISSGKTIPKVENNSGKTEYILPNGEHVWLNSYDEVMDYTMKKYTKYVNHPYSDIEKEILRLCNIERAKAGVQPLEWYEDAYYFTQIRAKEQIEYPYHTRPNGKDWSTVYRDAGVHLLGTFSENLFYTSLTTDNMAERIVGAWMNSPGHKRNILDQEVNRIAISVIKDGDAWYAVQNFFR